MQLVDNPVKRAFETQHDGSQDSKIITCRILLGNYAVQLLAEKFQGDPLFTHAAKHGCDQPTASTLSFLGLGVKSLRGSPVSAFIAALKMGEG
jgi:hypothetical protein